MSAAGEAVELLMAARGRLRDAEDVVLRVHGFRLLRGQEGDAEREPAAAEFRQMREELRDFVRKIQEEVKSDAEKLEIFKSHFRDLLFKRGGASARHQALNWGFMKSDRTIDWLRDTQHGLYSTAKAFLAVEQGLYSDFRDVDSGYSTFLDMASFERPEEMTDEQVRELAGCLAEAGEKVGAAAELVPSERLEEIRRALEVFRDEVLGTLEG